MSLLEDARRALKASREEYEKYLETGDPIKLRNCCEKGWLATVLVTDYLLTCAGVEKPRGRVERNELMEALEKYVPEVRELGLADRMWARAIRLHAEGFYEGWISNESLKIELDKVRRYLEDVEKVMAIVSSRREDLKHILSKIQEKFRR